MHRCTLHPPSPVQRGGAPAADSKRPHPAGSLLPTAKRVKSVALDATFTQGFTAVKGVKPKASDYAPIPHGLLIRTCADYSACITCEGYGEHKIIAAVRQLQVFNDSESIGVVFPTYFNPISLFHLALDMTLVRRHLSFLPMLIVE